MDMQMHYLGNSARRVPMNQDEFDTKFNFCKKNRKRHLSVDEGSGGDSNGVAHLVQMCCACCRDNSMSAYNLEAMARHSATVRLPSAERRSQAPRMASARTSLKRGSLGGVARGASTVTVPLCYELNYDGGRALVFDDDASTNEGMWRSKIWFISYFPLIDCLQRYSFRKDFFLDLRAGVILGLHSAAEGFIFSYLAGVPPMIGLYTAFCATFVYMFFGTSPYSIMGSNILVCFLVRNIIERMDPVVMQNATAGAVYASDESAFQIVSTLTFLVAFYHFVIYVFRLEFTFSYLSEHLLAGLSVGAAIRILLSQLPHVLNIREKLCTVAAADGGTTNDLFATFGAQNQTPSYLYCAFWSTYRRIFGAVLHGGISLNETALKVSEGEKSLSTLKYSSGKCVSTVWDCLESLNVETLILSVLSFFFLVFCRQVFDPLMRLRLRLRHSISFELLLIMLTSVLSQFFLNERLQVRTLEYVGEQFHFNFPRLTLFGELGDDALALALLSFAIHARNSSRIRSRQRQNTISNDSNNNKAIKDRKHNSCRNRRNKSCDYNDVGASDCTAWWNERQELFAFVMIGIVSLLFAAYPSTASDRRTRIATESGTRSTVVNVSLALTLLPLIVWWPIFLRGLPVCVLSCVIVMRAGSLLSEIVNFGRLWNVSRIDLVIFTFVSVVSLVLPNLSHAIFIGVIFAASTIVMRLQCPTFNLLVNVTGSGAYYAEKAFYGAELDESGVAVIRYEAPILFNNVAHFHTSVLRVAETIKGQLLGVGIGTRAGSMKSMKSINTTVLSGGNGHANAASVAAASCRDYFATTRSTLLISGDVVPNYDVLASSADQPQMSRVLILDFSAVSAIDICGIDAMKSLYLELAGRKTRLLFASVNSATRMRFKSAGGFDVIAKSMFFPSVHDAVLYAQQLGGVIAPSIHMSVSMNGCRDLITLSATTSHLDMSGGNTQHNLPPSFLPSGSVTVSQPTGGSGDTAAVLERSQSGGGSIANLTIASNNSQPTASMTAPTVPAAVSLDTSAASSVVPSPTPSQQQPLVNTAQSSANKLHARYSNS